MYKVILGEQQQGEKMDPLGTGASWRLNPSVLGSRTGGAPILVEGVFDAVQR